MRKSVLILGSTGRFGRHAAEAFWNAGWGIRSFDRQHDDLDAAAMEADVIIAAWNPPYPDWAGTVLPLHAQIQRAAKASGATVILPGNVYVYGAETPTPWTPETPHQATNPLGQVRIALERSYRDSGVQTIVLRAGDFLDTEPSDSWLDKVILSKLAKGQLTYPGRMDAAHAWAYLPDLAQAAVMLADQRGELAQFNDIAFPGYTMTGAEFADAVGAAVGRSLRVRKMPWWPLQLARPLWPMGRCLCEMRYLWDVPHFLDGAEFKRLCPAFRPTPLDEAMTKLVHPFLTSDAKDSTFAARGGRQLTTS
ncbi:epimerase [Roseovarius sp. 2305UL8-3]|uniref:epimerase n=1 Tax=Roseovarius conchicola TaxID=3121636 RepID=UPI003527E3A8